MVRIATRPIAIAAAVLLATMSFASAGQNDGAMRVELTTAYNFIVDSNVETPATYAPRAAYISARIWNDGAVPISNVRAYIGDKIANTPGIYPSRAHPPLVGPLPGSEFAFTHEGGTLGALDATRQLPDIPPGGYVPVYWLVSYPNLDVNGDTVTGAVKPDDDLFLYYDVWATGSEGATPRAVDVRRRVHMRNCISAMANKIFPNTANKVPQEYQDIIAKYDPEWNRLAADGSPGTNITTEGIWYDLGNVGHGFDNDGNLVPDQNAWLQPVGDPTLFDSSAFRLHRTFALIVVKLKDGGEQVYDVSDQLYFSNLPDNTGVIGLVRYDYLSLKPNATSATTPYQMAASGFDNEKFNGDYGASFSFTSPPSAATINKTVNLSTASAGDTLNYTIDYNNTGLQNIGDPAIGMPLVVQDAIPPGTKYVSGTAAAGNTLPAGVSSYEVRYSTDSGATWTTTEPVPATSVTNLQWWLSHTFAPSTSGTVTFSVTVDNPYLLSGRPVVNVAGLSIGNSDPFIEDNASTRLTGSLSISGTTYEDTGAGTGGIYGDGIRNGTEPAIDQVAVLLYYDTNNNNVVDDGDVWLETVSTDSNGNYSFSSLPNGEYVVQVDRQDTDIPAGYTPTSAEEIAVTLSGSNSTGNNFGFAPTLLVTKSGTTSAYPGQAVTYTIGVENKYTATRQNIYTRYAGASSTPAPPPANKQWTNIAGAVGAPDTSRTSAVFNNASEQLNVFTYTAPPAGTITKVELLVTGYGTNIGPGNTNGKLGLLVTGLTGLTLTAGSTADITDALFNTGGGSDYTFVRELVPATGSWTSADVTNFNLQINANKGSQASTIFLNAVGLRITVTQDNTLSTVPLTDTYNADELEFVSATPTPDSTTPLGTLTWNNIGPIAPGASSSVTVNFTAKSLPGASSITTTDTARVTGATFANGDPANDGEDPAETVILPTASIGDTIFVDANRSGSQDLSEAGISGVTVQLYRNGVLLTSDVTDANGNYLFSNLLPKDNSNVPYQYEVRVVTSSLPNSGVGWALSADPDLDGVPYDPLNPDPLGDSETTRTVTGGEYYAGADFGYYPPGYALSGTAWIDFDDDGLVDASEVGIQYVTVNLYNGSNTLIGTTVTDADGAYNFVGLSNGNYRIEVITTPTPTAFPPNLTQTYDPDVTLNNQTNVTIAGASIEDINFGYRYAGTNTLSGTIGMDTDPGSDGLMNGTNASGVAAGESAFAGVTVYLYSWNDPDNDNIIDSGESVLLGSTVTDADGDYSFSGLPASEFYLVSMAAPYNNLLITSATATPNHPADLIVPSSNSQGYTTGAYAVVTAAPASTNIDFAFISAVDYDFGDLPASYSTLFTNNGARHIRPVSPNLYLGTGANPALNVSTEPDGQPSAAANLDTLDNGVTVTGIFWQNEDNGGTASVNVVGSGYLVGYIDFNNDGDFLDAGEYVPIQAVATGTYNLSFDIPAGTLDEDGSTGLYARFRLLPTQPFLPALSYSGEAANGEVEDYLWNFHSITGTVFGDADNDLGFSGGDSFVNGVQVQLWHNSVMIDSQVTGLDGTYSFYGLTSDNYEIRMVTPSGYTAILDADGNFNGNGNTRIDVPVTNATVTTRDFLLGAGGPAYASLSGTVFIDTVDDNDFTVNPVSDAVFAGVPISLYRDLNSNGIADPGELVGSAVTDNGGNYLFPNLSSGSYLVKAETPPGYIKDVDGSANGNNQIAVTMAGTDVVDRDFLYETNASISGTVMIDTSGDTVGEIDHVGVVVQLLSSTGTVLATTTTNASGDYYFPIAIAGNYQVRQIVPAGYYAVDDVDGGDLEIIGDTTLISVANGANVTGQDFVNRELCSVGNFVWYDADEDGNQDALEMGINGVTVRLLNSSNLVLATTTTADNGSNQPGYYEFTNLETGVYRVEFVLPNGGLLFSAQNADNLGLLTGAANSDASASTGRTNSFTLTPGQDAIQVDAGMYEANPCPDDWTEWKAQHPTQTPDGNPGGNPDADNYDNFAEFAFHMPYNSGETGLHLPQGNAWIIRPSTLNPDILEGVFVRPTGAPDDVTYTLQYAATLGNPTVWQERVIPSVDVSITIVNNGDCTETVTINNLHTATGLNTEGFVRIKAVLDDPVVSGTDNHTSYTEVEGWTRTVCGTCCSTYNVPYQREAEFTGTVAAVNGQTLEFTGENFQSYLASGASYYVEVTNGANEGQRFDVASASGNALTLVSDNNLHAATAPFNTLTGAPPAGVEALKVILRRHWTLNDVFPPNEFEATGADNTADQVQIYSGGAWQIYWLYDENGAGAPLPRWVEVGDSGNIDQGGVIIPPGQGMFFYNRTASSENTLLAYGEVRRNNFIRPLAVGNNLVGGGYPVDQSPNGVLGVDPIPGRNMNKPIGFFGSTDFKQADSIFIWKADSTVDAQGYDTYFLLDGAPKNPSALRWVKHGINSSTSFDTTNLLLRNRATQVRTKDGLNGHSHPKPWTANP